MNGELDTPLVGEHFTVCLDDDGHPITRKVAEMTTAEVVAAIGRLADETEEQPLVTMHTGKQPIFDLDQHGGLCRVR